MAAAVPIDSNHCLVRLMYGSSLTPMHRMVILVVAVGANYYQILSVPFITIEFQNYKWENPSLPYFPTTSVSVPALLYSFPLFVNQ